MAPVRSAVPVQGHDLDEVLTRAVATGVITPEQAVQVAALAPAGQERTPQPSAPPAAVTDAPVARAVVLEVLGYLGGVLVLASGIAVASQVWDDLAPWARVGLGALAALAAGTGGLVLRHGQDAVGRLASFLWLVCAAATAGTAALFAIEILDLTDEDVGLVAAGTGLVVAAGLWRAHHAPLQQIATFVGLVATAAMVMLQIDADLADYVGVIIWVSGVIWIALARTETLDSPATGWIVGSIAALVGPLTIGSIPAGASLSVGLLTAVALVVIGVRTHRIPVAVLGTLALLVYVPGVLGEVFDNAMGPMAITFVTGLVLIVVSVALARGLTRRTP